MNLCKFILFYAFWILKADCLERSSIPAHLLECYRQPPPLLLPMTVNTLVDIVRKINFNSYTPVSVSQQAADVLYWFSVDGLERDPNIVINQLDVIPYHQTGFQAYKQDLLFRKLIPTKRRMFDAYSLSPSEKCTLHFMMSASVDPWERGDEMKICPNSYEEFRGTQSSQESARFSSCPVEGGAVLTPGGSVSVGHVVAGLAAALAPQEVSLLDLMTADQLTAARLHPTPADVIRNTWAATLAGDLAEVASMQDPQYDTDANIGIKEQWNDTYIPAKLYFSNVPYSTVEKRSWQITDAEILGGMDGLLLGREAVRLKHQMPEMRLSQLLEMYYLDTRHSDSLHVCNRQSAFNNYITDNKQTLTKQTQNFAALLTTKTTSYFTDSGILAYRCMKIVEHFMHYYPELLSVKDCPLQNSFAPKLNLILILDATWPPYTTSQFLVSLSQRADISYYGGSVAIINGDSSDVSVNTTSSSSSFYQQLVFSTLKGEDPVGLVLGKSLLALRNIIDRDNKNEQEFEYPRRAKQDVIIVMGHSSTVSDQDLDESKDILTIMKSQNPALRFVYWTSHVNAPRFVPLTSVPHSELDSIVATPNSRLGLVLPKLQDALYSGRILKPAYCKNDSYRWPESLYDEFISPGKTISYWIHPCYLRGSLDIVKIMFKNYDCGELRVCMSRDKGEKGDCRRVGQGQAVTHTLLRPCEFREEAANWCLPVYFTVTVISSRNTCTEYECRFQDQVKFSIIVQDLHCINLNSNVCSRASYCLLSSCVLYIFITILSLQSFSYG